MNLAFYKISDADEVYQKLVVVSADPDKKTILVDAKNFSGKDNANIEVRYALGSDVKQVC